MIVKVIKTRKNSQSSWTTKVESDVKENEKKKRMKLYKREKLSRNHSFPIFNLNLSNNCVEQNDIEFHYRNRRIS